MTIYLLEEIFQSKEKEKEIIHLLPKARNLCKLKYLNGSSIVSYGIPLYISINNIKKKL